MSRTRFEDWMLRHPNYLRVSTAVLAALFWAALGIIFVGAL